IKAIAERVKSIHLADKSKVFNTARVEALEVENLIEVALATMVSAAARHESRGAHTVNDYADSPEFPNGRNDPVWLKHTLWYSESNRLDYKPVQLKPLPGLTVISELIVDMTQLFKQDNSITPYLVNDEMPPEKERLQSPEEREELNGLYECILCASCSTSCPSFWWNPDKFVGP